MLQASLRMFIDCSFIDEFHIDYEVQVSFALIKFCREIWHSVNKRTAPFGRQFPRQRETGLKFELENFTLYDNQINAHALIGQPAGLLCR